MNKVAVIFADGTEEIEALAVVDVIRRANVVCDIISINDTEACTGSHNIKVIADNTVNNTNFDEYNAIVIPGGLPGAYNIAENKKINSTLVDFNNNGKIIASICASPAVVLSPLKITDNKRVTCFPAEVFINALKDATYTANPVESCGNLITANGPKSAIDFAIEICKKLNVVPKI